MWADFAFYLADKCVIKLKMMQWWNYADRKKVKYYEKTLFQYHFVNDETQIELNAGLRGERQVSNCPSRNTNLFGLNIMDTI
jgi:hypothetical protein